MKKGVFFISNEHNITTTKDTYKKLSMISKSLNIEEQKLVELAFNELFDLILSDPSIFLEKVGIIDNLKRALSEE